MGIIFEQMDSGGSKYIVSLVQDNMVVSGKMLSLVHGNLMLQYGSTGSDEMEASSPAQPQQQP